MDSLFFYAAVFVVVVLGFFAVRRWQWSRNRKSR
jgi:hypothetical protein